MKAQEDADGIVFIVRQSDLADLAPHEFESIWEAIGTLVHHRAAKAMFLLKDPKGQALANLNEMAFTLNRGLVKHKAVALAATQHNKCEWCKAPSDALTPARNPVDGKMDMVCPGCAFVWGQKAAMPVGR